MSKEEFLDRVIQEQVKEDGQEFKYDYIPWDGYFESLEAVHVDRVKIV